MQLLARTCKSEQMNFQRIVARFLLICGIAFTFWMGFGNQYAYQGQPLGVATAYGLLFSGVICFPSFLANRSTKACASMGMSSFRCRSGGRVMGKTLSR